MLKKIFLPIFLLLSAGPALAEETSADTFSGFWVWRGAVESFKDSKTKPAGALVLNEHSSGMVSGKSIATMTIPQSEAWGEVVGAMHTFNLEGKVSAEGSRKKITFKVFGGDGITVNESTAYLQGNRLIGQSTAIYLSESGEKTTFKYSWSAKRS